MKGENKEICRELARFRWWDWTTDKAKRKTIRNAFKRIRKARRA